MYTNLDQLIDLLNTYNPTEEQRWSIIDMVTIGMPLLEAIVFVCYKAAP